MVFAFVGSGGKTTLIKEYTKKYRALGKKVFVTTSTHMYIEDDTFLSDDADEIIERLELDGYVFAGIECGEKITALSLATYEKVCRHADIVLVEADGSKRMPIKFPNSDEPVIYDNVDCIVVVAGLQAIGKRLKDVAHRRELVMECLGISEFEIITAKHIEKLINAGYVEPLRKKYPGVKILTEPRNDGSLYQRAVASLIKNGMSVELIKQEWFAPLPTLFVCGGGHVSKDLVSMASRLDFNITVMDDRAEFANKERFPEADTVICDSFENIDKYLKEDAFYTVVTRGHKDDYACLKAILEHSYKYLGMIGSKGKVQKNFEHLREDGVSEVKIATIHAPIGLKIGAVTPAEIAVSILAEIIMEKNKESCSSASEELLDAKESGVLCIIIAKNGSSPRGVGSMMFVSKDKTIGSIGGGAVEYAAIKEAENISAPMIKEYDLSEKDKFELGMICGGTNKVLFIPV